MLPLIPWPQMGFVSINLRRLDSCLNVLYLIGLPLKGA